MKSKVTLPTDENPEHPVTMHELSELHFDMTNPRYGPRARKFKSEHEIVDLIANEVGIEDVLSSMAVNGFFPSEPLIGIRNQKSGSIEIKEGNRRLATCIILSNDPRARNQQERHKRFAKVRKEHGEQRIAPVPVMVFEGKGAERELLPYLGVKHIVGALPWDAY